MWQKQNDTGANQRPTSGLAITDNWSVSASSENKNKKVNSDFPIFCFSFVPTYMITGWCAAESATAKLKSCANNQCMTVPQAFIGTVHWQHFSTAKYEEMSSGRRWVFRVNNVTT